MQAWYEVVHRYWNDDEIGDHEYVMYRSTNLSKAIAELIRVVNRTGSKAKGQFYYGDENNGGECFIRTVEISIEDEEVKFIETRIEE